MKRIICQGLYKMTHLLLISVLLFACKKVDQDQSFQEASPSVYTSDFYYDGKDYSYPSLVVVGDTITLRGRLHIDQGGTVSLGNAQAKFILTDTMITYDWVSERNNVEEIVRFIVTPEMGNGTQPLILRNGSHVTTEPAITIQGLPHLDYQTDTTLMVTEWFTGTIPSFSSRYGSGQTIFAGTSVTAAGEIWMQTKIDLYHFKNGQVDNFLKAGDSIQVEGRNAAIKNFLGIAADPGGTFLYLSLKGALPEDASTTGHWYLLKMDLVSRAVTVLNHTTFYLDNLINGAVVATVPASSRTNGPVAEMSVDATDLKVDAKGRLIFNNASYIGRIGPDGLVTDLLEFSHSIGTDKLSINGVLGYSFDGLTAFILPATGGIMSYDLGSEGPIAKTDDKQKLILVSYEARPEYRFTERYTFFPSQDPTFNASYLVLPNGELLQRPSAGSTIVAFDVAKGGVYAYAGLEKGFEVQGLPGQPNITGPARYVDFNERPEVPGPARFIGVDAAGNIYFMRGGVIRNFKGISPTIYRLGK